MEALYEWKVPDRYYAAVRDHDPTVIGLAALFEECAFTHADCLKADAYGGDPAPLYVDLAIVLLDDAGKRERLIALLTAGENSKAKP